MKICLKAWKYWLFYCEGIHSLFFGIVHGILIFRINYFVVISSVNHSQEGLHSLFESSPYKLQNWEI